MAKWFLSLLLFVFKHNPGIIPLLQASENQGNTKVTLCYGLDIDVLPKPHEVIGGAFWKWLDTVCDAGIKDTSLGLIHRATLGLRV